MVCELPFVCFFNKFTMRVRADGCGRILPTPQECARWIIKAMTRRQREEVMTLRGKLGLWLKLIAPAMVDRIARRGIESGR